MQESLIYHISPKTYLLEETRQEIENKIEDHYDLIGVQRISLKKKSFTFVDLCGQLRFQQRWAQSPRIPRTSVLGHMLVVAILTYLSLSVDEIEKNISEYELLQLEEKILPLLPQRWHEEFKYLLGIYEENNITKKDEFKSRIRKNGKVEFVTTKLISESFNKDIYQSIDGEIIEICV
ncbi:MAG: HD domain-containing protein [Candidatus Desulfofervidaceae bacterium]|nr:HD domain-containing protein [Candidatus Desulfofervidaceae bacterium]